MPLGGGCYAVGEEITLKLNLQKLVVASLVIIGTIITYMDKTAKTTITKDTSPSSTTRTNEPMPAASTTASCAEQFVQGTAPKLLNTKLENKTQRLCFTEFAVLHSGVTHTPLWAAEHLTAKKVQKDIERKDNFHAEPALSEADRSELADYSNSGYDRGHLAPAADMSTARAMTESFSLANMTPQNPTNNRGLWSDIESRTRDLTKQRGELYVVSGVIFAGSAIKRVNNRVFVPANYFKAIFDAKTGESGAYLVTNNDSPDYKTVSITELSKIAGIDPFPSISATSKNKVMPLPKP